MKNLNQLLLDFNYEQNFKDDDFYVGKSNFYAFEMINKWPKWEKNFLNINGEKFSGKSHLVNIFLKKFNGIRIDVNSLNDENIKSIKPYQNIVLEDLKPALESLKKFYDNNIFLTHIIMRRTMHVPKNKSDEERFNNFYHIDSYLSKEMAH